MTGRHTKPELAAVVAPLPWYIWTLRGSLVAILLFDAGAAAWAQWWDHYRLIPLTLYAIVATLSGSLECRNRRRRKLSFTGTSGQ